jgi:hypothetical protein
MLHRCVKLLLPAVLLVAACTPVGSPSNTPIVKPLEPQPTSTSAPPKPVLTSVPRLSTGISGPPTLVLSEVDGKAVVLMQESLTVATDGNWAALGLVRNETTHDVGSVSVSARLLSKDGTVLDVSSATVLVDPMRPGEPGPFKLTSKVSVSEVNKVEWTITSGQADNQASRQIDPYVAFQVPGGVSEWKGSKRSGPPYPHELRAGFKNVGEPVNEVRLVVAWVDSKNHNQIANIATALVDPTRWKRPFQQNGQAMFEDVRVLEDDIKGLGYGYNDLSKMPYMLWAVGR